MIDGPSDMGHFDVAKAVDAKLENLKYKPPGRTAVFGSLASSHPLVHHIGGEEDTNQNTTRRILLLLESVSLSDITTHERVIRSILERYIVGDPPSTTTSPRGVKPRTVNSPPFVSRCLPSRGRA